VNANNTQHQAMPLAFKALCLLLVGICLVLGVVGLVLPIIPGVLFLFLAAILLAKVSSRFDSLLNRNSEMRYWRRRWERSHRLPLPQRLKLSFWMLAKAVVNAVEVGANSLKKNRTSA
jgi:uncharacterized membrane protein YbaN (DUF454 family)